MDKESKTELEDSFEAWLNVCYEAAECFERHKDTSEPTDINIEAITDKVRKLPQKQ